MTASRITLVVKEASEYESLKCGFGFRINDADKSIERDEAPYETVIKCINYCKSPPWWVTYNKSSPDIFEEWATGYLYKPTTPSYKANFLNAFLYSNFIGNLNEKYARSIKDYGIYLKNFDVEYTDEKETKTRPFLHYAIVQENKRKDTRDYLSGLGLLLQAKDIALVINEKDTDGNTVFDLVCEYYKTEEKNCKKTNDRTPIEQILGLLLEKCKSLNILPVIGNNDNLILFLNYLKKFEDVKSAAFYQRFLKSLSPENLSTKITEEKITLAEKYLETDHAKIVFQNKELNKPLFENHNSLFLAMKVNDNDVSLKLVSNCLLSENILKNINEKNSDGLTAAEVAVQNDRYDILCELYKNGADISRALAMTGPLGIAKLLSSSSSSKVENDFAFKSLLQDYKTNPDLLDASFSQLVLDILEKKDKNRLSSETLKKLIKLFPDLKSRLSQYIMKIADEHMKDGIGAFLIKQSLDKKEDTLYPAFAESRGRETLVTATIRSLSTKYRDLILQAQSINNEKEEKFKEEALNLIRERTKKEELSSSKEKTVETPEEKQITELLPVEKAILSHEIKGAYQGIIDERKNCELAFALAGPTTINILLKNAKKESEYHFLIPTLEKALEKSVETKNFNDLFTKIKSNGISQKVLTYVVGEQKDFSQRLLKHLDTLDVEEAYDILEKALTDYRNPFHAIWAGENTTSSSAWAKLKSLKEKLLTKSREFAASYLESTPGKDVSGDMNRIFTNLGKEKITATDYKTLQQISLTSSETLTQTSSSTPSPSSSRPQTHFIAKLTKLRAKYAKDIKSYTKNNSPNYNRLSNKIKVCDKCLQAIEKGESVNGIRDTWEKLCKGMGLFSKSGLLFFADNALANTITDIIKNESKWITTNQSVISSSPFNPFSGFVNSNEL